MTWITSRIPKTSDKVAAATDLVGFLIRSLAQEACDGVRGAQTYYRIVSRARDILNHINELIAQAETSEDWDSYFKYTAQIEPLETFLFIISQVVPEETETAHEPLKPKTIQDCLDKTKSWHDNRDICRHVSKALHGQLDIPAGAVADASPFQIPEDYNWADDLKAAADHDDLSWVAAVVDAVSEGLSFFIDLSKEKSMFISDMKSVIENLAKLQVALESKAVKNETMVLVTRCFMVMHGVITVAVEIEDEMVMKHLLAPRTWEWALELIEKLQSVVDTSSKPDDNLQRYWDKYEDYLLNPGGTRDVLIPDIHLPQPTPVPGDGKIPISDPETGGPKGPGDDDGRKTPDITAGPGEGDGRKTPDITAGPGEEDGRKTPDITAGPGEDDGRKTPDITAGPGEEDGRKTPDIIPGPGEDGGRKTPDITTGPGEEDGRKTPDVTSGPGEDDGRKTPDITAGPGEEDGRKTPDITAGPGEGDGRKTPDITAGPGEEDGRKTPDVTAGPGEDDGRKTPDITAGPGEDDGRKTPDITDGRKTPDITDGPGEGDGRKTPDIIPGPGEEDGRKTPDIIPGPGEDGGRKTPDITTGPGEEDGRKTPDVTSGPGEDDGRKTPDITAGPGEDDGRKTPDITDGRKTPDITDGPGEGDGRKTPDIIPGPGEEDGRKTPDITAGPGEDDGRKTPDITAGPGEEDGRKTPDITAGPGEDDGRKTPDITDGPGEGDGRKTPDIIAGPGEGDGRKTPDITAGPGEEDGRKTPDITTGPGDEDGRNTPDITAGPGAEDGRKTPDITNRPVEDDDVPKPPVKDVKCLIPYPAKIRRPYHAQALVLVKLCFDMHKELEVASSTSNQVSKFNTAIDTVIKALESSAAATDKITQFNLADLQAKPASQDIKKAQDDITVAYSELGMPPTVQKEMSQALRRDSNMIGLLDKHIASVKTRDKNPEATRCECGDELTMKLHISDNDKSKPTVTNHPMKSGGDVDAVLWSLSSRFSKSRTTLADRPRFYVRDETSSMSGLIRRGKLQDEEAVHVVLNTKARPFISPLTEAIENTTK